MYLQNTIAVVKVHLRIGGSLREFIIVCRPLFLEFIPLGGGGARDLANSLLEAAAVVDLNGTLELCLALE